MHELLGKNQDSNCHCDQEKTPGNRVKSICPSEAAQVRRRSRARHIQGLDPASAFPVVAAVMQRMSQSSVASLLD
jgi:hypothetical protein